MDWQRLAWEKAGAYKWHEMQDPIDYYSVFEQPRIHSTKVSLYPTFSLSEEVSYALNTAYVLPVEDTIMGNYLLGVLNSRVCEFYCRRVFAPKANGYFEIQPRELSRLPIPDESDEERARLESWRRRLQQRPVPATRCTIGRSGASSPTSARMIRARSSTRS